MAKCSRKLKNTIKFKFILALIMWFIRPMLGSNIHAQTIAKTIIGVMNGKKYTVLKNSLPLNFVFNIFAKNNGIITPKIVVVIAYITVFPSIL